MTDLLLVEKVDREAAADLIDAYWRGQDEGMKNLAISYRNGHTQGVWAQAFAAHRIAAERAQPVTVASLYGYEAGLVEGFKQGIEAAAKVADEAVRRIGGSYDFVVVNAIRALSPQSEGARARGEPTEAMWGGLARDIMMWLDFGDKTPRALFKHLERCGRPIPQWLRDEPEMKNLDHVPSKGTRCVIIWRAMEEARVSDDGKEGAG